MVGVSQQAQSAVCYQTSTSCRRRQGRTSEAVSQQIYRPHKPPVLHVTSLHLEFEITLMSGPFEIAAGAFAVVGVADVLIRSGRELYSFLQRIDDAPGDVRKLQQTVQEVVALVDASKSSLEQLAQHPNASSSDKVILSFRQALNSLERELKSLKTLVAKIKGTTKKWDRIKFALDQNRIAKAFQRLEHSKLSITAALTLGNG